MFSKADANCGLWQVPLEDSCKPLTMFITPIGRYNFNKLPFGISSATRTFSMTNEQNSEWSARRTMSHG